MNTTRIPSFANKNREGMARWFSEMARRGLMFHPEDNLCDIISIATGKPFFQPDECTRLDDIMAEMFDRFGEGVCETACPIFMRAAGFPASAMVDG